MTAYPGCAGLARSPFVLTEHISSTITKILNWRASEASETLLVVVQWKTRYVYTYIYIRETSIYVVRETHFCGAVLE